MSAARVGQAFIALNDTRSSHAQRREADAYLRQWVLSRDAWKHCDELLLLQPQLSGELSNDSVVLYAATSLRSKIMYDITQLTSDERRALQDSLLQHLVGARGRCRPIFTQLAVAYADLTIHGAADKTDFVQELVRRFASDISSLLMCLKVLPEENVNERVLCDPAARDLHADVLIENFAFVVHHVAAALSDEGGAIVSSEALQLLALECFEEWMIFALDSVTDPVVLGTAPFSGVFYNTCTQLLRSTDAHTKEAAVHALSSVLVRCGSTLEIADQQFVKQLSSDFITPNSPLHHYITQSLQQSDPISVELAQMCRDVGIAERHRLTETMFSNDSHARDFLTFLLQLTDVPYDIHDEIRGRDGVMSLILDFWKMFVPPLRQLRVSLLVEHDSAALSQLDSFLSVLSQRLLSHCSSSQKLLEETTDQVTYRDWLEFRESVLSALQRVADVLSLDTFIDTVTTLFAQQTDLAVREGLLAALAAAVRRLPPVNAPDDGSGALTEPNELYGPGCVKAIGLLRGLSSWLDTLKTDLNSSLESLDLIMYQTKTTAYTFIEHCADKFRVADEPVTISSLLQTCAICMFDVELAKKPDGGSTRRSHFIQGLRHRPAKAAANAFCTLCIAWPRCPTVQTSLPQVISLLKAVSSISDDCFCPVLEGIGPVIRTLPNEEDYQHCVQEVAGLLVANCCASDSEAALLSHLDRLTCFLISLRSEDPAAATGHHRQTYVFSIYEAVIWPLLSDQLSRHAKQVDVIEKSCRVAKHAMRCVSAEIWKSAVAPLAERVVINSEQHEVFSSYLYVAEWLVVYANDPQLKGGLQRLFNTLTARAAIKLEEEHNNAGRGDVYIGEDYYGILCRYLRYSPATVACSPTLTKAFQLVPQSLLSPNCNTAGMCASFLDNAYHTLADYADVEGGEVREEPVASAIANFRLILTEALPTVVKLIFHVVQRIPNEKIVHQLAQALRTIATASSKLPALSASFQSSLEESVRSLPPAVIASNDNHRAMLQTLQGPLAVKTILDIYHKCRQLNLRTEEATLLEQAGK